jgi:cytoskeletal protein CcmA (bactofilin family)
MMFGDNKNKFLKEQKDSERSLISETVVIEGNITSSGSIDIAGKVQGPIHSKEIVIKETGSVFGEVESDVVEINGSLNGKISAQNIVIGSTGVVKGDMEFSQNLRTEDGADIEGYIKKTADAGKKEPKLPKNFLFAKDKNVNKNNKDVSTNGSKE